MNHAKHHPSLWQRGLSALLAVAFAAAELAPAAAYAQGDETRARVRRLRELNEARQRAAAAAPVPGDADAAADDAAPSAPAPRSFPSARDPAAGADAGDEDSIWQFNLVKDAPLDALLDMYSQVTGRTMIKAPGVNATFPNIKVKEKLTKSEMLQVMDSLLSMNNISLVPLGTRFYRVVQIDKASTEGMSIQTEVPEGGYPESDALVSQLIRLKYLGMEDANNIVGAMLHGYGKVQRLDRINSLLVLETSTNLRRINDILEMVDQPTELNVETSVYVIRHAKAADIAARLNELASDSEQKEEVARVAEPRFPRRPPSMMRARQPAAAAEDAAQPSAASTAATAAEKGIIQGKVKILTDERTNIIIVITNPVNLPFFNMIVNALDVSVDPEVEVQVVNLEFADAEEMASLLNNFIGASSSSSESSNVPGGGRSTASGDDSRAQALENFVRARASAADRNAAKEAVAKIGQLSSDTKILADTRTNTILLMGTKGDIAALLEVIKKVDIMLAQVLIEAVILEVNLHNDSSYGISWLQKSMTAYNAKNVNGISVKNPVVSWGGSFGGNNFGTVAGDTVSRAFAGGTGLSYFFTFTDLNMDAVLDMVASSGEGRVLATPVILTTDNTEASIISGQSVPIRTGDSSYSSGTYYGTYEYKDVGIELKVKPRINPSRYVTLEISQSANTLGDQTDVGNGSTMYKINKRELTASISLPSRSTIVLGGLVETDYSSSESHIPILGSIPIIGALFRSENKTRQRTELLVLITPYVLMTPEEARAETERLHRASNVAAEDWYRGWSDSSLAPFSPAKLKEMRKKEKAKQEGVTLRTLDDVAPGGAVRASGGSGTAPLAVIPADLSPDSPGGALPDIAPDADESPLPAPEDPVTAAPFTFDATAAAAFATPADDDAIAPPAPEADGAPEVDGEGEGSEPAAPAPRRSLFSRTTVKTEDPRPSMFPAP
ncbi:MAG: type II secretion system secretin GspD [Kiritimatiellae bacterium]|nr:type II secretion system secretin GspD [Kiritimatiellia bacterium]